MMTSTMAVSATVSITVGVAKNDWIQWQITVSGQGQSTSNWLKVTITGTNATTTTITGTYESNQPGWPTDPTDFTVDLLDGKGIASIYNSTGYTVPLVVSANLTTGDPIEGTNLQINGTTEKDGRAAAFATVSSAQLGSATYYWDREKGVLLEFSTTYAGATTLMKASSTNMWNLGSGTDWTLWIAIIVIVIAAAAVVLFIRRRRFGPKNP
jgi:hypothetical protein